MEINIEDFRKILPPPPVILISTLYGDVKNIAPFAWNMTVSMDPPLLAVSIRETRDTYKNILETKEFVVAVPTPDLVKEIDITARSFSRDVSEFEKAGLTPIKSKVVKPFSVKECQANIECILEWIKEAGDHHIVVGRVVCANLDVGIQTKEISRLVIDPVYHVAANDGKYAGKGEIIDIK